VAPSRSASRPGVATVAAVAAALVVGLVLGGLGPRRDARAVRQQLETCEESPRTSTVGRDIAAALQGRPLPTDALPPGGPRIAEQPAFPDEPAPPVEVQVVGDTDAPPVAEGEGDVGLGEQIGLAADVLDMRRAHALQALREDAWLSEDQLDEVNGLYDEMNDDLIVVAEDLADMLAGGAEPDRLEAMTLAAEVLNTMVDTEHSVLDVLDDEQLDALGEDVTDPLSFIDPAVVQVFEGIE